MPRGMMILGVAGVVALISALAAFAAWQLKPAHTFAPLSLPDPLVLTSGSTDIPPQIQSGAELKFGPTDVCNASDGQLNGHMSISIISADTPPQPSIAVLAGLPLMVPKGCTNGQGLDLKLPNPLPQGAWKLVLTISVQKGGETQTLSKLSAPFVVTP